MKKLDQRIKVRHLLCFLEVERMKSMLKAAEELSITQPAVSKTVRELEDVLDVRLFDRSKKSVTLTDYGKIFISYAASCLSSLRQGIHSIAQAKMKAGTAISVGALPTVAARIMPTAVYKFKKMGSNTTVRITCGPNNDLISKLRMGELDIVVGRLGLPDQMTGLRFSNLYSESVTFVVRPGHPLLKVDHPDLSQIGSFTVLLPTVDSIIRPVVDSMLISKGVGDIPDRIETVSNSFGRNYVRNTDSVWIISYGVVASELSEGTLVELEVEAGDTSGPVGLTTRRDSHTTKAVEEFTQAVRDASAMTPVTFQDTNNSTKWKSKPEPVVK